MMTTEEKRVIQLLLVRCSQYGDVITKVYCSDNETLDETFRFGARVLKNCRGINRCLGEEKKLIFQTGSEIQFLVTDNSIVWDGCDEENDEKEAEVQAAFEEALRNMGKKEGI